MHDDHHDKNSLHTIDGITENRRNAPPPYFTVLFFGLILWALVFMGYFLFSGWSSEAEFSQKMNAHQEQVKQLAPPPAAASVAPATVDLEQGRELFASNCAMCHGEQGKGGIGPDLTAAELSYGRSTEAVRESIAQGRPGGMPGFGTQLAAAQIDNLTAFVLSLQ